jgi:23S rRNA (adenine2503-C2)-methyltransferase
MSDLSRNLRKKLQSEFTIFDLAVAKRLKSADGTEKFLFKLEDGNFIEAVIIPAAKRVTACISSQAGCKYRCSFCASGVSGFRRNLSAGEISQEVLLLKKHQPVTHIVFMGTGEPLDNYENVLRAIRLINSKNGLNIGARRITISTCGVIPGIKKLAGENLQVELSISLHSADEKIRSQLMPVNKIYPLKVLITACKDYIAKTDRQVTFEYVLIKGLNSSLPEAKELGKIMKELKLCKVNLIPANCIKELGVDAPERKEILSFRDYLLKQGLVATLRRGRGEDIEAACGQLRLHYENK